MVGYAIYMAVIFRSPYGESLWLFEQVVHRDDALYAPCIFVEFQAVCRNERKMKCVPAFCLFLEGADLVAQVFVVRGGYCKIVLAKFHFANVIHMVGTLDDKVYLCAFFFLTALPWAGFGLHATYTECLLFLWQMADAQ